MPKLVAIEDAAADLDTLARQAEAGETVVLTRDGAPVLDLVPHRRKGGLDWEAARRYKEERGIKEFFTYVAPDFDDPVPEDFLLRPLP
jgi:antitoxin (DNA-binding transcriptional repressor) of toxin-antitoxin stability system